MPNDVGVQCQRVHAALRAGRAGTDPELAEHVASCPACASLVAGGVPMAAALDAASTPPPMAGMLAELRASFDRERGPRAWLRSRPTWLRLALAAIVASSIPLLVSLAWARIDRAVYPLARLLLDVAVVLGPAAVVLWVATRPLHRPWSRRLELAGWGLAVLAVAVAPSLPTAHELHPGSLGGTGAQLLPRALGCLVTGTGLGLPVYLGMGAIARQPGRFGLPVGLAAAFAGLVGALSVFLHCALVAPQHLFAGHSTVLLVFVIAGVLAGLGRRFAH